MILFGQEFSVDEASVDEVPAFSWIASPSDELLGLKIIYIKFDLFFEKGFLLVII